LLAFLLTYGRRIPSDWFDIVAQHMEVARERLLATLESHYRESGWTVERSPDGTICASGPGGVTWIGAAVVPTDLEREDLGERLIELATRRMEGSGELCPLELLPSSECDDALRSLLSQIGLARRSNVAVYSLAS
jgi:hypothetical protein